MNIGLERSLKRTSSMSQHQSPETIILGIKNEGGPKAQLQTDESNAPTCKSRNTNDLLLEVKLGCRPSFKGTSPMLQHPSPETLIISY